MYDITLTQRFSINAVLCLCLSAMLAAQTPTLPNTIGYLDSKDALVFEGNQSYTKDQICEALYRDKDVIVSISPTAPFSGFLKMLETKVRLGYLNDGFYDPQVKVSYVGQPEHILISIVEGPRYTKGPLVIHGASDSLKDELTRCLDEIDPRVTEATGASEIMESIRKGEMNAALTSDVYMALLWGGSKPPSFAPSFVKTSAQYLQKLLMVLGYYHSEFTLKPVPNHAARTVGLHIAFQYEGTRASIGAIEVLGNTINSDEQVQAYLGLKNGQPLDDLLVYTLQTKLLNTGRFRFVDVEARINTDEPQQSTLTLVLEETALATPLDQELTEKEVLMQKVGQFFDHHQSWEKDVLFQVDSQKNAKFADWLQQHQGISAPVIEWIYSSTKGIVLSEIINQNQTLNVIVISPEQIRYVCPPMNQNIICNKPKGEVILQLMMGPDNAEDGKEWSISFGMGLDSDNESQPFSYQPQIDIHPSCWFHLANDPESEITFVDDRQALIKTRGTEIAVDRQSGEVIEIQSEAVKVKFQKGIYDERIAQLEKSISEHNDIPITTRSGGGVIWGSLLPLYLTHAPHIPLNLDQKKQAVNTLHQIILGFNECSGPEDRSSAMPEKDFPLPIEASLAEGGMLPLLLSAIYQGCHDNLPRDSWVRTLSHVSVLMVSGHGQCASVSQELHQLYNSDQIGPVGYLLTAQIFKQLGFPASDAFAQRGLQTLSAEDFRKDWQPLLTKDSKAQEMIRCYLGQFQTCSDEDIRLAASVFPPELALLMEAVSKKLKKIEMKLLHESLDPVLTDFWEKSLKEQVHQQLNNLIAPPGANPASEDKKP